MADLTLTDGAYRALLIPDQRFTLDALSLTASSLTQDGSRAGTPEPQRPTRAVLSASGEQDDETLTITAKRGGFARERAGAAFTWESTGVTGEIGWETPTAINDLAPIVVNTPTYARLIANCPAVCSLPDGRLVTAFVRQNTAATDKTSTRRRLADGTWQSPVDVGLLSSTTTGRRNQQALIWDDARQEVRLYVLWRDTSVSGRESGRLSLYTSDDGGASWALAQEDCLTTPLDWSTASTGYTVTGISIAITGDLGSLLVSVTSNDTTLDLLSTVVQYASADGGFTFDLVEAYAPVSANDSYGGGNFKVYADPSGSPGFRVVWSSATSTDTGTIYGADLGSPFTLWSAATGAALVSTGALATITSKVISVVAVAVAVDPVGAVWVYYDQYTATSRRIVAVSVNSTGQASVLGDLNGSSVPWVVGLLEPGEGFDELATAFHQGGVFLLGRLSSAASSTTYTGALIGLTLGGYSGVTRRPVAYGGVLADYNAPYEIDWFGIGTFGSFSQWSVSSAGTPTTSLDSDLSFTIECPGVLDSYQATYTPSVTGAYQGHGQIILEVRAGSVDFTLKSDGVFNVRLRISSSQIVVRDMTAGADLETISLPTPGAHIIRASWNYGGIGTSVDWRVEVTPWTQGATVRSWDSYSGTLSAAASAGDRCRVEINYLGEASLYHVGFGAGNDGAGMAQDTLTPRPFSPTPCPVYHGVNVALSAGPVVGGDSWTIAPWYDFGVRRIFQEIEPSPRAKFKTTLDASASTTALIFNLTDDGNPIRFGSPIVGLGFFGANFRTAEVYTSSSSTGPWTKVADVDLSCGLSGLAWERVGYTVSAPASTPSTGPYYIPENALAGGTFIYKSGEARRILRNTGGVWQNGADVKRPRLALDGPSTDASGTGGVIVYPDGVALIYGLLNVQYLRILIPSQDTASGVLELGSLVLGRVEILGKQYGRGRSLEVVPSVDTFTSANGSRRSRVLAPPRRLLTVDWQENAIDTSPVYADPGAASYVRAASGQAPAAYPAATADQIRGLLGQLDGAPLVYISKLTPDQPTMIAPSSLLRGRVLGPLTIDAVLGDEEQDEVVRVAGITIEEEL